MVMYMPINADYLVVSTHIGKRERECVCVCVCVCARTRACVRACMHVCPCMQVCLSLSECVKDKQMKKHDSSHISVSCMLVKLI